MKRPPIKMALNIKLGFKNCYEYPKLLKYASSCDRYQNRIKFFC